MIIEHPYIYNKKIKIDDSCLKFGGSFEPNSVREPEKLEEFANLLFKNANPVLLDVGACTGSYSLLASLNKNLIVYAFEPTLKSFQHLKANIEIHELLDKQVFIYNQAISNYEGIGKFYTVIADSCIALSMLDGRPAWHKKTTMNKVNVITIDSFCGDSIIPTAIKIDTEGNELNVLRGAKSTIEKYRPLISCEFNQENTDQYGYNVNDINKFLTNLNYSTNVESADLLATPN
jgi:FkbM family methyltransferase